MLTHAISDARSWTADSIDAKAEWYYPLPESCWSAFDTVKRNRKADAEPFTDFQLADPIRRACALSLYPARQALEIGRGFVIIEGPNERLAPTDAQLLYWIIGLGLGQPF